MRESIINSFNRKMKGKEYLKNKNKVLDLRKTLKEQKVILADCYYWKDVYEALRLESNEVEHKHQVSMECARESSFKEGIKKGKKILYKHYFKDFKKPVIIEKEEFDKLKLLS